MKHDKTVRITTPSDREVVVSRDFDAPRGLVFEALTKPELLRRWLEAPGRAISVCEVELRVGGAYRYLFQGPGKKDVGLHGVYREIVAGERIVNSEVWEDWDAGETLVTTELAERDGITILTSTMLFPSNEARDIVLKSGLEKNMVESYDKLEACLASGRPS